jgi:hypothetical protein
VPISPSSSDVLLLDEFLPQYDVRASYHTQVAASPSRVYASLHTASLDHWGVMRRLLLLRRLPEGLSHPEAWRKLRARHTGKIRLEDLIQHGFALLGERAGEELVLGTVGRFWSLRAEQWETDSATFRQFDVPGAAQAALNFVVAGEPNGTTRLTTETRVRCTDEPARRRFRRYWALVGPFSGLIRREMLAAVRAAAERS